VDLLDAYAGLDVERGAVAQAFAELRARRAELETTQLDERERAARTDLVEFQLGELERAQLKPDEDDELTAERRILANADRIERLCLEAYGLLYESDQAALGLGSDVEASRRTDGVRSRVPPIPGGAGRAQSPARGSCAAPAISCGPCCCLAGSIAASRRTSGADRAGEVEESQSRYRQACDRLGRDRRTAADRFSRDLERILAEVAMGQTRFAVRFGDLTDRPSEWSFRGSDTAEFYVSPNPGEELRPLSRTASGGELSRIMLALKTLVAARSAGTTMIFDEVDAGIGGRIADIVGARLRRLAGEFQVLCITHLPQLAAHATAHFHIEKRVTNGRTLTSVARLSEEARIEELARMAGVTGRSEAARASAKS
jgi:DNA repair protein RecN (Recombination protein N)